MDAHEIVDLCHERITQREEAVGAWQWLRPRDECHAWLRDNADWLRQTPLCGLPVAVKDIIDTADAPTGLGSALHRTRQPSDDAACVSSLRAAGALVLGKTVTTEFAYFSPGKTANPHDLNCTPGGSSSGSAAAVADGMVPVALGSQTAASVIRPASYCGVYGYVATRGLMALRGVQPLAPSFDSLGLLAADPGMLAEVSDVLTGAAGLKPSRPLDLRDLTLLQVPGTAMGPVSDEMVSAVEALAKRLRRAGALIVPFDDGGALARLVELHGAVMAFEAARNMAWEANQPKAVSPEFADLAACGRGISLAAHAAALEEITRLSASLERLRPASALFLAPAAPGSAPEGLAATGAPHMSRPWQALGLPVISLPAGLCANGRPLGVQLIGRRFGDAALFAAAEQIALLSSPGDLCG
ncbi:amidase [Leisingera daeponensis]|uniref:amidase n=1 Tax=Leisingera daeponensis TaxID=405746 RepID=UPI001C97D7B5|nr:amidase [Leisingera daeponensis]MBY6058748.1 amidase [Leisingera daeponensis]